MTKPVLIQGTLLKCSFGNAPAPIMVLPDKKVKSMLPVAVKSDHIPLVNILPFGMCSNPANPMVIAATAAEGEDSGKAGVEHGFQATVPVWRADPDVGAPAAKGAAVRVFENKVVPKTL